ncbi:MAG TPA: thiamine phosphate synthase [Candidatus Baltobacteraceae bacterium]|nr:thiamine phosphate synthase [Candidatus Baltobacteraceae bacterium]
MAGNLLLQKIEQAAKAGVDWIQIREKDLSGRELAKLTEQAILGARSGSSVLLNDRIDVACTVGAAGVHLGENSLPVSEARKLVDKGGAKANFLVGVSAHSLEGALQAEHGGADYVIFGPVYTTPSKASFGEPQGVQRLREICKRLTIPVLAIGGITLENAGECVVAGAAGIAAIRLFQDAEDLDGVVRDLRKVS